MIKKHQKVVVAMSGGVDSSVAAALLVDQGYEVIGMMLRLWNEPGSEAFNRCCTPESMALARRIAAQLGIPFYTIDVRDAFYKHVVRFFLEGYAQGITPNPCLNCNRTIRWGALLERARAIGADKFATGHYARLRTDPQGRTILLRGLDRKKDQSYVLSVLAQEQLACTLLPVGDLEKTEVREIARKFHLPVAEKPDSQDLCFLAGEDYRKFLQRQNPDFEQPGPIVNASGEVIGTHQGLAFYTIGQRKGLGIATGVPLYVKAKIPENNTLLVTRAERLGNQSLRAREVNWVSGSAPEKPFRAQIKIRYTALEVWGNVSPEGETQFQVRFDEPLRDITPGQGVVVYNHEICLGGGIITA